MSTSNTQSDNWQSYFKNVCCGGKLRKRDRAMYNLLGQVKRTVTVEFPDFQGYNGLIPAHTDTLIVTEDHCDIPNGFVSVPVLASNLVLWMGRGYKITTC